MESEKQKHKSKEKINEVKIIKEKNKNENKNELKNILIKEIDKLIVNIKEISKELIHLSDNLDMNNLTDVSLMSTTINDLMKMTMDKLNNQMEQYDLLNKKRFKKDKEDKHYKIKCKICEYKNKKGNIIGYNIKCEIMNINYIYGPWNSLDVVKKIKNKFMGKISDLKINENTKSEEVKKFYDEFKQKIYIKYPPNKNL